MVKNFRELNIFWAIVQNWKAFLTRFMDYSLWIFITIYILLLIIISQKCKIILMLIRIINKTLNDNEIYIVCTLVILSISTQLKINFHSIWSKYRDIRDCNEFFLQIQDMKILVVQVQDNIIYSTNNTIAINIYVLVLHL